MHESRLHVHIPVDRDTLKKVERVCGKKSFTIINQEAKSSFQVALLMFLSPENFLKTRNNAELKFILQSRDQFSVLKAFFDKLDSDFGKIELDLRSAKVINAVFPCKALEEIISSGESHQTAVFAPSLFVPALLFTDSSEVEIRYRDSSFKTRRLYLMLLTDIYDGSPVFEVDYIRNMHFDKFKTSFEVILSSLEAEKLSFDSQLFFQVIRVAITLSMKKVVDALLKTYTGLTLNPMQLLVKLCQYDIATDLVSNNPINENMMNLLVKAGENITELELKALSGPVSHKLREVTGNLTTHVPTASAEHVPIDKWEELRKPLCELLGKVGSGDLLEKEANNSDIRQKWTEEILDTLYEIADEIQSVRMGIPVVIEKETIMKKKTNQTEAETELSAEDKAIMYMQKADEIIESRGDTREAMRLYRLASDIGNIDATIKVASILYEGLIVKKDLEEAARLFQEAAKKGSARAMCRYGECLKHGLGVAQNLTQAAEYFRMSSDKGDYEGMRQYGLALKNAKGVPRDRLEGERLINMARALESHAKQKSEPFA